MSMTTSVVSAAILEGNLILGLSDGSVINCGYVQGPPGLKGDAGPMGADGDAGRDGNTIITVAGTPRNDAGTDGDYAIDNVNWRIYGPKSGGTWGKANEMLPSKENLIVNGRGFEGGAGAGGGGDTGGGGGGGEGIRLVKGGDGIKTQATSSSVTEVEVDADASRGLAFYAEKLGLNIGDGLEFDAFTGQLKSTVDDRLPYRIETDKITREGKPELRSGEAEIQLVDNQDNYSNVRFAGTNGVDVTSTASSIIIDGSKLAGDIAADLSSYATIAYSDGKDQDLQNQIDDLEVQKGAAANYDCKAVSGSYNARPGECDFNDALASNVTILGLGQEDKSGKLTKTINVGDIIEIVGADGSDTRYKATDVTGAPIIVLADFVSGEQTFVLEQQYTVFIYPQNEAAASKDYVDAQDDLKLDKAGGTLTGPLVANGPVTINGASTYNGTINEEESLVNRKYVDDKVNSGGDFLPLTGGKMLGNIEFEGSSQIKARGTSSLDGRASLVISGNADKPVAVDSGSSYLPALSIFGYDDGSPNNRKQVIDLRANGQIQASGQILSTGAFKSTNDGDAAFEAKPNNATQTCLIRSNGSAKFSNHVEILKVNTKDHEGFVIYGTVADGTEGKLLQSFHNTDPLPDAVNYSGKIEQPKNIVNKGYVDSVAGPRPAQLNWVWEGDKGSTTTAPATGKFLRTESSGTDYIRFNFESYNGVNLGDQRFSDTNVNFSDGPVGTIWYFDPVGGGWRLKMQFRVSSWRWNYNAGGGQHFEFGLSSRHGRNFDGLTLGSAYSITVGGFF